MDTVAKDAVAAGSYSLTRAQIDTRWKSMLKIPENTEYQPTIQVKVNMTGLRGCRIWLATEEGRKRVAIEDVDWRACRVQMIAEARSIWLQPTMMGNTVDTKDIQVFAEDESDPFTDGSEEEDEQ